MLLILAPLVATAVITFIEIFLKEKKIKWILFGLTLAVLAFTYFQANKTNRENDKLAAAAKRNEEILLEAKSKLEQQTKMIDNGFTDLTSKLSSENANSSAIVNSLNDLKIKVAQFADSSNSYVAQVLGVAKTATTISTVTTTVTPPVTQPVQPPEDTIKYINIPTGDNTSRSIDSENHFAIFEEQPNEKKEIIVMINGAKHALAPGGQYAVNGDQGKIRRLVYKGKVDGFQVFYVKN